MSNQSAALKGSESGLTLVRLVSLIEYVLDAEMKINVKLPRRVSDDRKEQRPN